MNVISRPAVNGIANMMTKTQVAPSSAYDKLLLEYRPRPITTDAQYKRVLHQIEALMRKRKLSRAQDDLLELLGTLVARYETACYPTPDVSPAEMVTHFIEVRGVTKAEVARATGIPRQTVTNIVNGSRGISKATRAKLAEYFHVSPEVFLPNT